MTGCGRSRSEVRPGWGAAKVRGLWFLREPLRCRGRSWATHLRAHKDSICLSTPAYVWLGAQTAVHTRTCTEELASPCHTHEHSVCTKTHILTSWAGLRALRSWGARLHCPYLPPLPLPSDRVSLQCGGAVHAQGGPHEGHAHEAVSGGHPRGHPDSNR